MRFHGKILELVDGRKMLLLTSTNKEKIVYYYDLMDIILNLFYFKEINFLFNYILVDDCLRYEEL